MDTRSEIKRLARIEPCAYPFSSLYLNTKWDNEQQRARIRLFMKNQFRTAAEQLKDREQWREAFAEDQRHMERYVEGLVRQVYEEGVNGVAIFCCSGTETFLTFPSVIPFENQFCLSRLPLLKPLVRLSSQYRNTLAVMVDTDSARLFEISLGGMKGESIIESYVPGRHDQGGWAQMRYQRHIKDHMDRHHKEVAQSLTELFDTGQWERIILMGQDRILANFKTFLPERVKQQIADTFPIDFSEERSKVLKRIFERVLQKERDKVIEDLEKLGEKTSSTRRAVWGLSGTLEALHRGQVHTLYLLTSFSHLGGQCDRCHAYFLPRPSSRSVGPCPQCKGEAQAVDLGEEMVRAALRQDAEVKWVEDHSLLKQHDGVGACLRFR